MNRTQTSFTLVALTVVAMLVGCHPYLESPTSIVGEESSPAKSESIAAKSEPVKPAQQPEQAPVQVEVPEPDLRGTWQLALPAGFLKEAKVEYLGDSQYRVTTGGNMGGVYELAENTLKKVNPDNREREHYVWKIEDKNTLLLVESPPVAEIGSDYRGAVLKRGPLDTTAPEPNLTGTWTVKVPGGIQAETKVTYQGNRRYRFESRSTFQGFYDLNENALTMFNPKDRPLRQVKWKIENANKLVVIEAPPPGEVGGDLRGTTLTR